MVNIDKFREQIILTTRQLVQIPSVEEDAKTGQPFGANVARALDYMLDLGRELGFETKNYSGYAGHIEFGQGEEILGVLCHLDVVPASDDWSVAPFSGEVVDGKIYGRGTIDNKGPAVAVLYGLAALKDAGFVPQKRIRLILGTDEESGWQCMSHYLQHAEMPSLGFAPDAVFPIINSEKGVLIVRLKGAGPECAGYSLLSLSGGHRPNMVPDRCQIRLSGANMPGLDEFLTLVGQSAAQISLNSVGPAVEIEVKGLAAHGSMPETGINAIVHALKLLTELGFSGGLIEFLQQKIGLETDGASLGIKLSDTPSGDLTVNIGVIRVGDNQLSADVDIRYPITYNEEQVMSLLKANIPAHLELEKLDGIAPHHVSADSKLIKVLQQVYAEHTGQEPTLLAIGGGTYARAIRNAVAFGPLFPNQPELAHQKDEHVSIDDLLKITRIYADAMAKLSGLDE